MKKILSIFATILCFVLMLTLAACNGGSGQTNTPPNSESGTIPPVVENPETPSETNILVVYFSASGSTKRVAQYIASATEGYLFELVPVNPYSSEDLNYGNQTSRVVREHDDESLRNIELVSTTVANWEEYDTVFVGYPIWWGIAAWPVNSFIKNNDFSGKTVIPFATSASSGMGQSGTLLAETAGTGNWQAGRRFSSGASESTVKSWVNGLNSAV